jgi:transposase
MKAYSQDLRQRVLRAIDQGKNQAEVAETFAISTATIKRYLRQRRESGHVLPKAIPGRPNIKGAALQAGLLEQLRAYPDASREQHCQMWEASHGLKVSPASITRARQALDWTRKKRPYEQASKRKPNGPPGANKPLTC